MTGVSRGHSTGKFREGLNKERMSTVSSSRNEQGRQKLSDRETGEQEKQVKPAGIVQSAEPFPARDNGKIRCRDVGNGV